MNVRSPSPTATHDVINQSTPWVDVNLFKTNRPLRDALAVLAPNLPTAGLLSLGAAAGSAALQAHARWAHLHGPQLHTHDRFGHRRDEVEFHPSYHTLLGAAMQHGLHGTPWSQGAGAHVQRAAGFMLFSELEQGVLCPVSMTYAVAPALRANPGLQTLCAPKLASGSYDARFVPWMQKSAMTMGMGMTEKQGGSDVRANTSTAQFDGDDAWGRRYVLTGHKWFFSAPMSDAFLVLAQTTAGLSCFFMPRFLPDGSLNSISIQRLKHKLGNQSNASSEVEFNHTQAWLVGEEGRGVPQILAMGALTRLDCALGTAGLMRQTLSLALHHTAQRRAFGKALIDQPLMQNVLADLAIESEAATALAMRLAAAIDRSEHRAEDQIDSATDRVNAAHEAVMRRLLTPIAKFWICKRGSHFAQEAMECLGGNGYVEAQGEGVMARIYREMPLNSIWEGAGNIMALDLLRALRGADVAAAIAHECAPAQGRHVAFDRALASVLFQVDAGTEEAQARRLARDVALLMQAATLFQQAPDFVFDSFCASRLNASADVFGLLPSGLPLPTLIQRAMPLET
jgi:putative acyl-CoA dehydrogenase